MKGKILAILIVIAVVLGVLLRVSEVDPGKQDGSARSYSIETNGKLLLLGSGDTLVIMDVSGTADPEIRSRVRLDDLVLDIELMDDTAVVACRRKGVAVVDLSTPVSPVVVGRYQTETWALGLDTRGAMASVACDDGGVTLLDLTVTRNPLLIGHLPVPDAQDTAMVHGYLYVADRGYGVRIVDLSDLSAPREIYLIEAVGHVREAHPEGAYLYILEDLAGIRAFDVTDPARPVELCQVHTPGEARRMAVRDDRIYIACGRAGIVICDAADPADLKITATIPTGGFARDLCLVGDMVYVSDWYEGLFGVSSTEY